MFRHVAQLGLVLGLILVVAGAASRTPREPEPDEPRTPTIRVIGEATVTTRPDRAEIDLAVVTSAPDARDAAAQNARKLDDVLASVRQVLNRTSRIETIGYMVRPDYSEPEPGTAPAIRGYTARNVVRVTLDDLSRIGAVIDTATKSGANEVERIGFTLAREDVPRARALREAALQARAKAESLAESLELDVVRIASVQETTPVARPVHEMALARDGGPTTPIVPGAIETTAIVELSIEVAPRGPVSSPSP